MPQPIRPEPAPGLTPLVSMFPLHIGEPLPPRPPVRTEPRPAAPERVPAPAPAVRQAAG